MAEDIESCATVYICKVTKGVEQWKMNDKKSFPLIII